MRRTSSSHVLRACSQTLARQLMDKVMAAVYGSRRAPGFSVLELLAVVAVGLVLAALAMLSACTIRDWTPQL